MLLQKKSPPTYILLCISVFCNFTSANSTIQFKYSINEQPECYKLTKRNITKTEMQLNRIIAKNNTNIPKSEIKRNLQQFKNTIYGLQNSISLCKFENPSCNFIEIDKKVITILGAYIDLNNKLKSGIIQAKKKCCDLNMYTIFLRSFPSSQLPKLANTVTSKFNRNEVLFYSSEKSDDIKLKKELQKFIKLLNSESIKTAFISSINDYKMKQNVKIAITELNVFIQDITHLKTVFVPQNTFIDKVILMAKKIQTQLNYR